MTLVKDGGCVSSITMRCPVGTLDVANDLFSSWQPKWPKGLLYVGFVTILRTGGHMILLHHQKSAKIVHPTVHACAMPKMWLGCARAAV